MSSPFSSRKAVIGLCWGLSLMLPALVSGQTNYYKTNGTEYAVIGSLAGDQMFPDVAVTTNGGFVVWQDNITDGDGWGVSAARLDSSFSLTTWNQRVNVQGTNDQQYPRVAMLKNGGAVFAWQGGGKSREHIYARFLSPINTFLTSTDVLVSTFTNNFQTHPAVTVLNNSNVVVVWSSFNQVKSNSLQDVYGQILSPSGQAIGANFLINQFTNYNQRNPSVAALKNGGFVVAWVSEQERSSAPNWGTNTTAYTSGSLILPSVDVYARLYASNGVAAASEFLVNTNSNVASRPSVAAGSDGGFLIAWCEKDTTVVTNSWDIFTRSFSSAGVAGTVAYVNQTLYGDQYTPRICSLGVDYLVVWTSLGQDGSREGVYGRFLTSSNSAAGNEFLVNTTTAGQQMQPVVASDGAEQFMAVWTGFTGTLTTFDLYAQRYINVNADLSAMDAPFVYAPFTIVSNKYQPQLVVSWPVLSGISVSNYLIYVDGAATNMAAISSNFWTMTAANGLTTSSTHSFQLTYVTTDGRSPVALSPAASGTTWSGLKWGAIPYEWMEEYYGDDASVWPAASSNPDGSSLTLYQIFLSGGSPLNSSTWLKTTLANTSEGFFLSWNTQPGFTYQVQVTTNLTSWTAQGSARFAAGTNDSIYVGSGSVGYYRVLLLRQ